MNLADKYRDARPPVAGLSIRFDWIRHYEPIFDQQIKKIRRDIKRERSHGNKVIYLSCPISNRGGGFDQTNVDLNRYTADRIVEIWGSDAWVLNPAEYQMESYRGAERLQISAAIALDQDQVSDEVKILLSDLLLDFREKFKPSGADYMRMWTKILAESFDDPEQVDGSLQPYGAMIDGYYFLGSKDAELFFNYQSGGNNKLSNVELFLAKEIQSDPEYARRFDQSQEGQALKAAYIDFYANKVSAIYSKGCHDEWNIWVELNQLRLMEVDELGRDYHENSEIYGIGNQIPGYWNQQLINPAASEQYISRGYAAPDFDKE